MDSNSPWVQWQWSKKTTLLLKLATACLNLVIFTIPCILVSIVFYDYAVTWFSLVGIEIGFYFLFLMMGLKSRTSDRLSWQIARNNEAHVIMDAISKDIPSRFILYLRPFDWIGALPIVNPQYCPKDDPYAELATIDLEEFLVRGVPNRIPIIALGFHDDSIGAGRYSTNDANWQSDVKLLAMKSEFIFIMPLFSSGTMWEIGMLKNLHILNKTIIIMPPSVGPFRLTLENRWQKARAVMKKMDITLPDYRNSGSLITFNSRGDSIRESIPFPQSVPKLTDSIRTMNLMR